MLKKQKALQLSILILILIIGMVIISGRGCPKRRRDTRIGSSDNVFMINAPSNLNATAVSFSQINLSWQDNSNNEDGFEIFRSTDGVNYTLLSTLSANTTSYPDTGLSWSTTYYYRVRTMNTIGDRSEWSNTVSTNTSSILQSLVWSSVAAGENHTIALTTAGSVQPYGETVWAWGRNDDWWQLGIGDTSVTFRTYPTLIASDFDYQPFTGVTAISAGSNHNLALKTDGTIWCWGANGNGQLGTGDTATTEAPLQMGADSDWLVVATGYWHTIGIKNNNQPTGEAGTIWAWGYNNRGQLGDGTTDNRITPRQIGTESDWSLTAGSYHTIGIKSSGTLWAWGYNNRGQLGDGTQIDRYTPSQIGTDSDWIAVTAGSYHTIALKSAGTLWAWGSGGYGQLGDGTQTDRYTPRQIGAESDWFYVTAGENHTIALKTNGTVWSWGWNYYGQLGDGTTNNRITPRQIGADTDWSFVTAGYRHTIGIKTGGTLWAWGRNNSGQLGLGDTVNRNIPCLLGGSPATPSSLIATALGLSQIALTWTDNAIVETGFIIERGITNTAYSPIATLGVNTTSYLDTGLNPANTYYYRVYAYNNLGNSLYVNVFTNFDRVAPSPLITTAIGLLQIAITWTDNSNDEAGFRIERKLNAGGTYQEIVPQGDIGANVTSWLDSIPISPGTYYYYRVRAYNEFGNSPYSNEAYSAISGNWEQITAGYYHTIGIKTGATLWAWGSNSFGQLGDGTQIRKTTPRQIGTDTDWTAVFAGYRHTIGLKSTGTLWAWGWNGAGQLGDGTQTLRTTPRQIGTDTDWTAVAAGYNHTIGIKAGGTLWAWGNNDYGQLGLGDTNDRYTPSQIIIGTDSDWSAVSAGDYYTIGIKTGGALWAWGRNNYSQLGDGTIGNRYTPRQISTDTDWTTVSAGSLHTIGLKNTGTLWAWGRNNYGQLGDGTTDNRYIPSQIDADTDWIAVTAGSLHTIGLKNAGTLWAWGFNDSGQLGDGTQQTQRTTPRQIGAESDWSRQGGMAAGEYHTIGLKSNNTLWSWGANGYGQLGMGDTINRFTPTLVGE